jgi:hypothetical protein
VAQQEGPGHRGQPSASDSRSPRQTAPAAGTQRRVDHLRPRQQLRQLLAISESRVSGSGGLRSRLSVIVYTSRGKHPVHPLKGARRSPTRAVIAVGRSAGRTRTSPSAPTPNSTRRRSGHGHRWRPRRHTSFAELEADNAVLPTTHEAITRRSGRHLWFTHPGTTPDNAGRLGDGIDVRGDRSWRPADEPSHNMAGGSPCLGRRNVSRH